MEIAKQICITTKRTNDTKLKNILVNNQYLDFNWIIIYYNYRLEYNNLAINTAQLVNNDLISQVALKISNVNLHPKFLETGGELFYILVNELNAISDDLTIKSKYQNLHLKITNGDFYFLIYYQNNWLVDIELYLKYLGKYWFIKFFDNQEDRKIKAKDEL